jgi:hypothetical protein
MTADVYTMECDPHGRTHTPYGPELVRWHREHADCPGRWSYRINSHARDDLNIFRLWEARRENGAHW